MSVTDIVNALKSRCMTLRGLAVKLTLLMALAALPAPATGAPAPQATPSAPQQNQGPAGRQQSSTVASLTITNDQVIRMVKAGVPESAIISSIQSSRGQFDLTPDGLLALHRAGVSQKVLETMIASHGAQPGGVSSNTSVLGGSPAAGTEAATATLKPHTNLGAAKVGAKVKNPRATQSDAAIMAVLKKQRSAADAEVARMRAVAPARTQVGMTAGQPQPMLTPGASQTLLPNVQSTSPVATNNAPKSVAAGQPQAMLAPGASQTLLPSEPSPLPVATNNGQKSTSSTQPQKNRVATAPSPTTPKTSAAGAIGTEQTLSATGAPGSSSMGLISSPQGGTLSSVTLAPGSAGPSQGGGAGGYQGSTTGGCAGSSGGGCAGPSQGGGGGPTSPSQGGSAGPTSVPGGMVGASNQPQGTNGGGGMPGSSPSNSKGSLPSSMTMTQVAPINGTAVICANNPLFRILTVSGSSSPATFTPIDQYDLYTINGCSFGNPSSNDKVYLYGTGALQLNFQIQFWSDNSIAVSLDPNLSGLPDLGNLTLVVQRADGQQVQKGGFSFYAARATVQLSTIPSSWANLVTLTCGFTCGNKTMSAQFSSPPTSSWPGPGPSAGTLYVSRYFDGAKFNPTGANPDWYDFTHLAPGFSTDSFQLTTYSPTPQDCPFTVTYSQDFGTWKGYWGGTSAAGDIFIFLSDTTCSSFNPIFPLQNWQNVTGSYYALTVWVNGPRGIDPMTGQPGQ